MWGEEFCVSESETGVNNLQQTRLNVTFNIVLKSYRCQTEMVQCWV